MRLYLAVAALDARLAD